MEASIAAQMSSAEPDRTTDAAEVLKQEARRRAQAGEFFGRISFVSVIARKPAGPA